MATEVTQLHTLQVDKLTGRDGEPLQSPVIASPTVTGLASTSPTQLGMPVTELLATATFVPKAGMEVLELNHISTIIATTIAAPVKGNFLVITNTSASGTAAHTVTLTAGDFDGGGGNVATLNAPEETLVVYGVSATRYVIIENIGTIVIS